MSNQSIVERLVEIAPPLWQKFRRSRGFVPALIAVPAVLLSGTGVGVYSAWDSSRVDVPNVVGLTLPAAANELAPLGLVFSSEPKTDDALPSDCHVISTQSIEPGTRVLPEETSIGLIVEPITLTVPNVVGASLETARTELLEHCFYVEEQGMACVPDGFSGSVDVLMSRSLKEQTGLAYDPRSGLLDLSDTSPVDEWQVCEQHVRPSSALRAESTVGVLLVPPLTTVPAATDSNLSTALASFKSTADQCALRPNVIPTFIADPSAVNGLKIPSISESGSWAISSIFPEVGNAVLCGAVVDVEVVWPSTTMPKLLGLNHVPESAGADTATTAVLLAAGLSKSCSGKGTVTNQVPAAGTPVPVGTKVTCVAELVVPKVTGMDPFEAETALAAAGIETECTGSGIVSTQSHKPGHVLTAGEELTCDAVEPIRAVPKSVYYKNCTAARAAGAAPIYRGEPGYRPALDRDNDGIACE